MPLKTLWSYFFLPFFTTGKHIFLQMENQLHLFYRHYRRILKSKLKKLIEILLIYIYTVAEYLIPIYNQILFEVDNIGNVKKNADNVLTRLETAKQVRKWTIALIYHS